MSQEKEIPETSDFMFYVVKQNSQFQAERDEALKKVAELEKQLAGQQAKTAEQPVHEDPAIAASIAQQKAQGWEPRTIAFDLF